jgi:hypothetical protein
MQRYGCCLIIADSFVVSLDINPFFLQTFEFSTTTKDGFRLATHEEVQRNLGKAIEAIDAVEDQVCEPRNLSVALQDCWRLGGWSHKYMVARGLPCDGYDGYLLVKK